jgi:hypothetical protein
MLYTVHQIHLTSSQIDAVNSGGETPEFYHRYSRTICGPTPERIAEAWDAGDYAPACRIIADNLDQVFEVGNIGPEESIQRINGMHSVSVGDVIEDPDGNRHFVAPFGFEEC